jgi:hypothetical protein
MMDPDPTSRWAMADCAHALRRIHDRAASHGTREETAAFVAPPAAAAAAVPVADAATEPEPETDPTPTPTDTPTPTPAPAPTPAPPAGDRDRRRGAPVLLVAAAVLVALVIGAVALLGQQDDQPDPAADSTSRKPGAAQSESSATSEPSDTSEPTPEETASEESTPASTPVAQGGSTSAFAENYYAVLPDDTETGWSQLTRAYQRETGSYDDSAAFWDGIDAVTVEDTSPAGPRAVDVTLTYTTDGSSQQEVRRLELVRSGDSYLISGSEIVG